MQGQPAPSITIELSTGHERYRERVARAAAESLQQYSQWLGPLPDEDMTILAGTRRDGGRGQREAIVLDLPWLSEPSSMDVEAQVAYALAKRYWSHAAAEAAFAHGLSTYLKSRIVERLFNVVHARPGHSSDEVRFFGGHVPWALPALRLSRWRGAIRHERGALAFASLERYLGWPVLQGALHALAATMPGGSLSRDHAKRVIGAAAQQDLAWFFDTAFDSTIRFDYAVTDFSTQAEVRCTAGACYRTRVVVTRLGDGLFTGSSRLPVGNFEAGTAMGIRVDFMDGESASAEWDGRAVDRTFEFDSAAPPLSARLDPEGTLLIDDTPLDHFRPLTPQTNVPVMKWTSRWLVWLQDALLAYVMLV